MLEASVVNIYTREERLQRRNQMKYEKPKNISKREERLIRRNQMKVVRSLFEDLEREFELDWKIKY
jgi:hypothetical protein